MTVVFTANNNAEMLTLPFVPPDLAIPVISNANEEFTLSAGANGVGSLNLPGLKGLRSMSISSFFPNKYYSFAKVQKNGYDCVAFFQKWNDKRVPIRIIITDKSKKLLNMPCLIESFEYSVDSAGDFQYTLDIKEFIFPVVS
ncbi:phage portal protein [Paenibacillus sp. 7124]|uniref:Phage portal protein n=1 Tax=Paenibacillus apii TaxID=1850370 RepID=A0A6M1PFD8_9BACL|nr:phage portal protein [Paenibacillus apii]